MKARTSSRLLRVGVTPTIRARILTRCWQRPLSTSTANSYDPPQFTSSSASTSSQRLPPLPASSAKLAALHARLSLPPRLPLTTLSRCLVDATADARPDHNNASLALLGRDLLANYTAEWLLCKYPRLPMNVLMAAQEGYVGSATLAAMRHEWGIEAAAAPGEEVDRGLLQFARVTPGNRMAPSGTERLKTAVDGGAAVRTPTARSDEGWHYRRGTSSRIVYDDEFGHELAPTDAAAAISATLETASADAVRAVFGALYLYAGAAPTHAFHAAHVLSRHLELHRLFSFTHPTRDLARLCAREGFASPVARLLSETGRLSRSPVFVVGVYSDADQLGEGAGASLEEARVRASAAAMRAWYLYSPPVDGVRLPSQDRKGTPWPPQMVDAGEVVT